MAPYVFHLTHISASFRTFKSKSVVERITLKKKENFLTKKIVHVRLWKEF